VTDLESLEALREAAARGEWSAHQESVGASVRHPHGWVMGDGDGSADIADAALIVALVNAFPAMAAELRALREVAEAAREACGWINGPLVGHERTRAALRAALAKVGAP
jgi:hypothetical protein